MAARHAGEIGDGLISTAPKSELISAFQDSGGPDRPRYGQYTVCWAEDQENARQTAYEIWPTAGVPGELSQELQTPTHYEQAVQVITLDEATEHVVCGPDPEKHIEGLQEFIDAGFDHVYVHQVGPDQERFLDFYQKEVLPQFA